MYDFRFRQHLESVCHLGARGTDKLWFKLALEEINNKRVISHFVSLPGLLCNHLPENKWTQWLMTYDRWQKYCCSCAHLIQASIRVYRFCVRFILNAVQILMKTIQQEGHKFLGVMLSVTSKLTGFTGYNCLWEQKKKKKMHNKHNVLHFYSCRLGELCSSWCSFGTLSFEGWNAWCVPFQSALSSTAKPMANLPPVPSGLLQLISASKPRSAET